MRISDWSSDVCSSYLTPHVIGENILGHPVDIALRIFDRIESAALHEPLEDLLHHVLGCCIARQAPGKKAQKRLAKVAMQARSEEHTSELQSLMRTSYPVFCFITHTHTHHTPTNPLTSVTKTHDHPITPPHNPPPTPPP